MSEHFHRTTAAEPRFEHGQEIRWFDELGRGDVDVAGGKGANLGELTRAGLPVPLGFVLTTAAYQAFLVETGIGEQLLALAAGECESASARIRDLVRSVDVPAALARELLDAAEKLGERPLAVRSSATAEDLGDASFAGQQDTYLGVRGADRYGARTDNGAGPAAETPRGVKMRMNAIPIRSRCGQHWTQSSARPSAWSVRRRPEVTRPLGGLHDANPGGSVGRDRSG